MHNKIIIKFYIIALASAPCLSFSQQPNQGYLMVSINSTKLQSFQGTTNGTFIGSLQVNNRIAAGVGISIMKLPYSNKLYNPIFAQLTYSGKEKKVQFFGDFQLGYATYKNFIFIDDYNSFREIKESGGLYFSPGIGFLYRLSSHLAPFLKIAYINTTFNKDLTATIKATGQQPEQVSRISYNDNQHGLSTGIGIKIF